MSAQDLSNEILNEIELEKTLKFAEDSMMLESVKKYILAVSYKHGVVERGQSHMGNRNYALNMAWSSISPNGVPRTDEELGQNLRALAYAVQIVESGFKELVELLEEKKLEPPKEEVGVHPTE